MYGKYALAVLFNPLNKPVHLTKDCIIGIIEELHPLSSPIAIDSNVETHSSSNTATCAPVQSTVTHKDYIQTAKDLGFDLTDSDLTDKQRNTLMEFLRRHRSMFATDLSELGSTNVYHHRIETGDAPPVKKRFYRQSIQCVKKLKNKLTIWSNTKYLNLPLQSGIAPLLCARKKMGHIECLVIFVS